MTQLKQTIGFWQGIGLLVTTLLGTGVFILPQVTANIAGDNSLFAWLMLVLAILPITYVFAELGKQDPHPAGVSYYIEKAFGRIWGKASGLMFILLIPVGAPAALDMITQFMVTIVTLSDTSKLLFELSLLAIMWLLNVRGIKASGFIQLTLTLAMLSVVVLMIVMTLNTADYQAVAEQQSEFWSPVLQAMAIALWSFLGIEALTHLSSEFKNPQRDFLPAMIIGTVVVAAIYVSCTWLVLPFYQQDGVIMVAVFDRLFGGYGFITIGILGIASGFATVNVYSAGISRLAWSFAQQGLLPKPLAKLNKHQVPTNSYSVIVSAIATVVMIKHWLAVPFESLVLWANGVVILIYFFTMLAALKLLDGREKIGGYIGLLVSVLIIYAVGFDMVYALGLFTLIFAYLKFLNRDYQPVLDVNVEAAATETAQK